MNKSQTIDCPFTLFLKLTKKHNISCEKYVRYYLYNNFNYFFGKKKIPGETKKEPLQKYSRSGERAPGMLLWTNQF